MADETQNGGAATAESAATSQNNAGNQASQSIDANQQVGNSGQSDADNGAAQGGEDTRQRPNRAERRIGALHSELAEEFSRRQAAEEENARLKAMLEQPLGNRVQMPDYSNVDQVTPEQLKQDIINTADQIVKIRLEEGLRQNAQQLSQRQANDRVLGDIDTVIRDYPSLDPNNEETYNEPLDKYLSGTFQRAYKADNTLRLKDMMDEYFALHPNETGKRQTNSNQATASVDRSKAAVRSSGTRSNTGGKSVNDMSADEYLAYIKAGGR